MPIKGDRSTRVSRSAGKTPPRNTTSAGRMGSMAQMPRGKSVKTNRSDTIGNTVNTKMPPRGCDTD